MTKPPMAKTQIRVLIVEDDLVDRMACRRALAQNPDYEFVLSEAETGREGLQLALAQKPDCVLLDYRLPDLNGLEFLTGLRDDLGETLVPVMMLTGADNASVAAEAMKRGAQDYLVKDVNRQYLELLPSVIQRVLRERRTLMEKKQVEAELQQHRLHLEELVAKRTDELAEANKHLRQDIVERERVQTELTHAKAEAEKANLAKSNFIARMSHELRTPLNAILGFAQLIETGSPAPTPTQKSRLNEILQGGWYLLDLINEILDLAVIESGKLSLSLVPVPLIEVMRECQAMIETQAQPRGITMNFLPFDATWLVSADRTRLKQVLINLLTNAIKYNREEGTVEVKCTCTPERIRISIKDSGVGLPAELQQQLFQPFNRLGQEGGSVEGTGIGLVVTKQLVELMGGKIGVKSIVGAGSEFRFELNRDFAPQLAAGESKSEEITPPPPKIHDGMQQHTLLYFEDNPANLLLVQELIEENRPDMCLLIADNGKLGIELARTYLPDVILMDINLPDINGIEAMEILLKDPLTAHIPVVALSANAMPDNVLKGMEAGFFRYICKPFVLNEFMSVIDEALEFRKSRLASTNNTAGIGG
ncbi:MAG: response regulator [Gallionella sp.]|nr:response regulator [Gallionella sp.]